MVLPNPMEWRWAALPRAVRSLPLFSQVAAVDDVRKMMRQLVVVGGWDPKMWAPAAASCLCTSLAVRPGFGRGTLCVPRQL
jgi:hypothetical protein